MTCHITVCMANSDLAAAGRRKVWDQVDTGGGGPEWWVDRGGGQEARPWGDLGSTRALQGLIILRKD